MRVVFLHVISREFHQVDNLLAELQGLQSQTQKLKVNAVGLSRGGIACSYLAQVMSDIPASRCWLTMFFCQKRLVD
jgi:poly(3-hydroxyalkanoate) synthetase